jgi:hypothetical protein
MEGALEAGVAEAVVAGQLGGLGSREVG